MSGHQGGDEEPVMFERFTDRARRVLVFAEDEARMFTHDYIGTEHLLLGILHEGEGVAAKALESLGVSLQSAREHVDETVGRGEGPMPEHRPFSKRAKKALELSLREALHLGHNYIGTEHLLLALTRETKGAAARVLAKLGADPAQVRSEVVQTLSGYTGADPAGGDPSERTQVPRQRQDLQAAGWTLLASGSESTWRALGLARAEAAVDDHPAIEVHDLVLGVLRTGDPQVAAALEAAGGAAISPGELAPDDTVADEPPPLDLSVQARDACVEALRAARDGAGLLRPAHLLLGCLLVLDTAEAAPLGARLGVEVDALVRALTRSVDGEA